MPNPNPNSHQVVRLDARWIAMLRYHLGTLFDTNPNPNPNPSPKINPNPNPKINPNLTPTRNPNPNQVPALRRLAAPVTLPASRAPPSPPS